MIKHKVFNKDANLARLLDKLGDEFKYRHIGVLSHWKYEAATTFTQGQYELFSYLRGDYAK